MLRYLLIFSIFLTLAFSHFIRLTYAESLSVSLSVGETQISFDGYTSPNAFITIKQNNAVIATTTADSSGDFTKTVTVGGPGIQSFELYASDTNSVVSPTISYTVNLAPVTLTSISNIVFPPTINPGILPESVGDSYTLSGLTHPLSSLSLLVSDGSTYSITPLGDGSWSITFTTSSSSGSYTAYLTASMPGNYLSLASETISYTLVGITSSSSDNQSSSATPSPTSSPSLLDNSATNSKQLAYPSLKPKSIEILEAYVPVEYFSAQAEKVLTPNSISVFLLLVGITSLIKLLYIRHKTHKAFLLIYLVARPGINIDLLVILLKILLVPKRIKS